VDKNRKIAFIPEFQLILGCQWQAIEQQWKIIEQESPIIE